MAIELKSNIFTLGLWFQIPHHVENITIINHQVIEHLKLRVIPFLWVHIHCIFKSNVVTMIEVTRSHTKVSLPGQLEQVLHYLQHGQHTSRSQNTITITQQLKIVLYTCITNKVIIHLHHKTFIFNQKKLASTSMEIH